jgi:(4-alkanoyl-5-oxo-2,5-dihydrofuran-3-yl)methyl phosphate reductase
MQINSNANPRYLITGATGSIGSLVVKRLLEQGARPRVFVRDIDKARRLYDSGVDIATGNLADGASLAAALDGVETMFLVNIGPDLAARDGSAAQIAMDAGVHRIVKLSTLDVEQGVGTGVWHAQGEAAIRATGISFTFVRPSGFMTNALFWAPGICTGGVVRSATGEGKIAFIHPDDIADTVTAAMMTQDYNQESLSISGPEALSYAEMTDIISQVIGRPLRFESMTEEEARTQLLASGDQPESIDYHLSIFRAIREGRMAILTNTIQQVLGRPPLSFRRWVEENAAQFSG